MRTLRFRGLSMLFMLAMFLPFWVRVITRVVNHLNSRGAFGSQLWA